MDHSIEEYKTLRTEILRNFEAMERNLIACITATGVALAYAIKDEPLLLAVANAIPIYFWVRHSNHRGAVAKMSAYISVFFEGGHTNLHWEGRAQAANDLYPWVRLPFLLRTFLHPYPVLLIVSATVSLTTLVSPTLPRWCVSVLVAAVIGLIWTIAKVADKPYGRLRGPWVAAFREVSANEHQE